MDGLYKKVLKGVYPKVPPQYTEDLVKLLKKLINVNAGQRPTCDQLLGNEIVAKWAKKLGVPPNESGPCVIITE